jgi:hypothetical protein
VSAHLLQQFIEAWRDLSPSNSAQLRDLVLSPGDETFPIAPKQSGHWINLFRRIERYLHEVVLTCPHRVCGLEKHGSDNVRNMEVIASRAPRVSMKSEQEIVVYEA